MRHPVDGVLRRLVDEPAGVSDPDREHVADCARCAQRLSAARDDAAAAAAAVADPAAGTAASRAATPTGVDAAWERFAATGTAGAAGTGTTTLRLLDGGRASRASRAGRVGRVGRGLRRPGVAALAVATVVAGAGTAAAAGWLEVFRAEEVAPVSFSSADLVALPDPSAFGEAVDVQDPDVRAVDGEAAAEAATGLDLPEVTDLPRGVTGDPTYQVGGETSVTFTFSGERAAAAFAAAGRTAPALPADLDGTRVRLVAGPGAAATWESASGVPALVVVRGVAPTAYSSGAPFEEVRDYALSLPGLPADVAAQLAIFTADGSTLPIPVPAERATTSTADVDGQRATVVAARDGSAAAVVWVQDGEVTLVAGSSSPDELLAVARGLR